MTAAIKPLQSTQAAVSMPYLCLRCKRQLISNSYRTSSQTLMSLPHLHDHCKNEIRSARGQFMDITYQSRMGRPLIFYRVLSLLAEALVLQAITPVEVQPHKTSHVFCMNNDNITQQIQIYAVYLSERGHDRDKSLCNPAIPQS